MAFSFRKFLEGIRLIPKTTGTASEKGDLEVTSGDGKLNYHNGTSSSPVVTEAHSATLSNKTIDTAASNTIKVNGNTLAASSGTATVTVPNSTDTLVGRATTDTLTNKTIDGDNNTIQDVGISSLKTVLADADKVIRRDASGAVVSGNSLPNSSALVTTDSSSTLTNKTIDGDNNTIQDVGISSLKTAAGDANKAIIRDGSGAVISDYIADANVKTGAAIARSKIASGTASHVIINDGAGALSSEAQLAISRGGTGQSTQTAGFNALSPLTTAGDVIVHNGTNNVRLARGTDGQVLVVDNNQTNKLKWTTLQQGAKNYILYGTFENNDAVTGWSLARSTLDSTTKMPNQAAASWASAAGTLSKSIISSGQLAGTYSLSLASSGATTAGDMLVTDALTLDLEAQASVQTFSFFYKVASGASNGNFSGTSSNSIGVAIYVVDGALAGTWIDPAGRYNITQSSGVGKAAGTFQVPSDATQVRLAVYFPNASSGAITVYLDDFVLGPQVVQYGAPVTDWTAYTPTGSWTTNTTYAGYWRRVGDSIEVVADIATSGAPTSAALTVDLPAGITIDANKLANPLSGYTVIGTGGINDSSTTSHKAYVTYSNTARVGVRFQSTATTSSASSSQVTQASPFTFGAGDSVNIQFKVPVVGWSSSVIFSNDTDTRVVAARARLTSASLGKTIDNNSGAYIIDFNVVDQDTHGAITTGASWKFTAPVSGFYTVTATMQSASTANAQTVFIKLYKNGVYTNIRLDAKTFTGGYNAYLSGSASSIYLNAGDYIDVRGGTSDPTVQNISTSADSTSISIERLSGPSAIAASETVACRYETTAGPAVNNTTPTITYGTRIFDTHNAMSGSTYTIPVSGVYQFQAYAYTASVAWTAASPIVIQINKSGVLFSALAIKRIDAAVTVGQGVSGTALIRCNAGDQMSIGIYSGVSTTLSTASGDNFLSIVRVGN